MGFMTAFQVVHQVSRAATAGKTIAIASSAIPAVVGIVNTLFPEETKKVVTDVGTTVSNTVNALAYAALRPLFPEEDEEEKKETSEVTEKKSDDEVANENKS